MRGIGSTIRVARKKSRDSLIAINYGLTNGMFYIGWVQKMRVKVDSK